MKINYFLFLSFLVQREEDWDFRLKDMMIRRIQNMAHLWFGRKLRSKFAWKLEQKRVNERRLIFFHNHSYFYLDFNCYFNISSMKQTLVSFISRKLRGFKARRRFE